MWKTTAAQPIPPSSTTSSCRTTTLPPSTPRQTASVPRRISACMCRISTLTTAVSRARPSAPTAAAITWTPSSTIETASFTAARCQRTIPKSTGVIMSARSRTRTATPSRAPTAGTRSTRDCPKRWTNSHSFPAAIRSTSRC